MVYDAVDHAGLCYNADDARAAIHFYYSRAIKRRKRQKLPVGGKSAIADKIMAMRDDNRVPIPRSWNLQLVKITGADGCNRSLDERRSSLDASKVVGGKLQNRKTTTLKVLLVTQILVRRDEQVELALGQPEQVAVPDAAPTALLRRRALATRKKSVHRPWYAFIQQNSHAAEERSSADSELSRTRRAISRVTDGKHSRNSSSV
jgi:hypothetical protein